MDYDPTDASNPRGVYSPYDFTSPGRSGIAKASLTRDWARRESVQSIPGMDSVLDQYGRVPGPMDRTDVTFSFTVWTNGDNDAAEDLLRAQVAPGVPQRLVYKTDSGALWFTVGSNPRIKQTSAAENNWGGGGECNFSVTWRIRPDWRKRFSQVADIWANHPATFSPTNSEVFGGLGTTVIAADPQPFTVDATGTAGFDLPTLPDTGPTVTLHGPCGGAAGIRVYNGSAKVRDTGGTEQSVYFDLPFNLPTAADSATLAFAAQTFVHNGAPFRPLKPVDASGRHYQREWFRIVPGVVNGGEVAALGGSALTGGSINIDWYKKRS